MDLIAQHCISPEDKRQSRALPNSQAWPRPTRLTTPAFVQKSGTTVASPVKPAELLRFVADHEIFAP